MNTNSEKKLIKESTIKETDTLDDYIMEMFGEKEELENTELSIYDDYTGIPEVGIERPNTGINQKIVLHQYQLIKYH